jgi:hypothetical protein
VEKDEAVKESADETTNERAGERGDVTDADAPTDVEENEGLSTVLSAEPFTGVQADEGDE